MNILFILTYVVALVFTYYVGHSRGYSIGYVKASRSFAELLRDTSNAIKDLNESWVARGWRIHKLELLLGRRRRKSARQHRALSAYAREERSRIAAAATPSEYVDTYGA